MSRQVLDSFVRELERLYNRKLTEAETLIQVYYREVNVGDAIGAFTGVRYISDQFGAVCHKRMRNGQTTRGDSRRNYEAVCRNSFRLTANIQGADLTAKRGERSHLWRTI